MDLKSVSIKIVLIFFAFGIVLTVVLLLFLKRQIIRYKLRGKGSHEPIGSSVPKKLKRDIAEKINKILSIKCELPLLSPRLERKLILIDRTHYYYRMKAVDSVRFLDAALRESGMKKRMPGSNIREYLLECRKNGPLASVSINDIDLFYSSYEHARYDPKDFLQVEYAGFQALLMYLISSAKKHSTVQAVPVRTSDITSEADANEETFLLKRPTSTSTSFSGEPKESSMVSELSEKHATEENIETMGIFKHAVDFSSKPNCLSRITSWWLGDLMQKAHFDRLEEKDIKGIPIHYESKYLYMLIKKRDYSKQILKIQTFSDENGIEDVIGMISCDSEHIQNSILLCFQLLTFPLTFTGVFFINYYLMGNAAILIIPLTVLLILWICIITTLEDDVFNDKRAFEESTVQYVKNALLNIEIVKMYLWEKPLLMFISNKRIREVEEMFMSRILLALYNSLLFISSRGVLLLTVLYMSYFIDINFHVTDIFRILLSLSILQQTGFKYFHTGLASLFKTLRWLKTINAFLQEDEYNSSVHDMIGANGLFDMQMNEEILNINNLNIVQTPYMTNILTNITFSLVQGEQLILTGNSLSGKSLLLKSILYEVDFTANGLMVNGSISYLSQNDGVLNQSIKDNILFGNSYDHEKFWKVIESCQLFKDIFHLSNQENTIIGGYTNEITKEQEKKILIARTVYQDAQIYLVDEPFEHLNINDSKAILKECFNSFMQGSTIIIATKYLQVVEKAERCMFLEAGRIIYDGPLNDKSKTIFQSEMEPVPPCGNNDLICGHIRYDIAKTSNLMESTFTIIKGWVELTKATSSLDRINHFFKYPTEPDVNRPHQYYLNYHNYQLVVKNLSLYISDEKQGLEDLNFEIHKNQHVCFINVSKDVNYNSILKSAFFRLYSGDGQILMNGLDLTSLELSIARSRFNIIPQKSLILSDTLRRNIDPFNFFTDDEILYSMRQVGLNKRLEDLNEDLNENLEFGEAKLISICRALIYRETIVIYEATYDNAINSHIYSLFQEIFRDRLVIILTNSVINTSHFDKVYVIDNGKIVEDGYPKLLLKQEGIYKKLLKNTFEKVKTKNTEK
ncbi:DgyrCDS7954 [Dimorphilus gyrociliatus]|uniref:DgyrCDS7954 n=1 Tax=Dimorphilus gyrociliatus TaxID=2664684 RepID=A0A7I8VSP8_9ANNE|nr:DgyrCDS7954 [Dimorphilus gyrociliatus]